MGKSRTDKEFDPEPAPMDSSNANTSAKSNDASYNRDAAKLVTQRKRQSAREANTRNLLVRFRPLLHRLTGHFTNGEDRDDLLQVASLALIKATKSFDETRGADLETYAATVISNAIRQYLRKTRPHMKISGRTFLELRDIERAMGDLERSNGRSPTDAELTEHTEFGERKIRTLRELRKSRIVVSLDDQEIMEQGELECIDDQESQLDLQDELGAELATLLNLLSPADRRVLELYFGFDGVLRTQEEVAEHIRGSRSAIQRALARAKQQLRSDSRTYALFEQYFGRE